MPERYEISAVISTYNRARMLDGALRSLLSQKDFPAPYEVIVVDNNSTDETPEIIQRFIKRGHPNLKYLFEPRQGVSYARNAGIAHANASLIAFADDDVTVAPNWLAMISREFNAHPHIVCVGGKVIPRWSASPPRWLTREHWSPLALQDYGDQRLLINNDNPLCLVTANVAFRRAVFSEIGLFDTALQRVKDSVGSIEDAELLERLWRKGGDCLYVPELIVEAEVPPERMTKTYHRRWHSGHGRYYAMMRSERMERSSSRLFDIPSHLFRQASADLFSWFRSILLANGARAFEYETRLRFFIGFFRARWRSHRASSREGILLEFIKFIRSLFAKKALGINQGS